jgi:hypothetical protein
MLAILTLSSCGAPRRLPDYSELLLAGVVPEDEAARVIAYLEPAGLRLAARVEVGGAIALGFHRERDDHWAIRVVTPDGVSLSLDSHAEDGVTPSAGPIAIDVARSGHDLDGDHRLDIVVSRTEPHRTCMLLIEVGSDARIEPLRVDAADLPPDVCLESLEDLTGDGTIEAVVGVYAPELALDRWPRAPLPLERDEAGVYRRTPPAVAFLETRAAFIDAALARARSAEDHVECLTLAVERALLLTAAGQSIERQLAAFDDAVGSIVWPEAMSAELDRMRASLERGVRTSGGRNR